MPLYRYVASVNQALSTLLISQTFVSTPQQTQNHSLFREHGLDKVKESFQDLSQRKLKRL